MRIPVTSLVVLSIAQPALAQQWPDLVGTWSGKSRAIVSAVEHHYGDETVEEGDAPDGGAFASADLTVEITEQNDGRYIGSITSAGHTEAKYMVIASDGVTIRASDLNGTSTGRMLDADRFELCYAQIEPSTVSCAIFTRAPGG